MNFNILNETLIFIQFKEHKRIIFTSYADLEKRVILSQVK